MNLLRITPHRLQDELISAFLVEASASSLVPLMELQTIVSAKGTLPPSLLFHHHLLAPLRHSTRTCLFRAGHL